MTSQAPGPPRISRSARRRSKGAPNSWARDHAATVSSAEAVQWTSKPWVESMAETTSRMGASSSMKRMRCRLAEGTGWFSAVLMVESAGAAGSQRVTDVPASGVLAMERWPPWARTMEPASVRPMPGRPARVVNHGSNTRGRWSEWMPWPSSRNVMSTPCFPSLSGWLTGSAL